jgi:shikimate dehydrogenase
MAEKNKAIYGLLGYPLGHSLSPLMHNAAFKALEVEAEYKLFSLEEKELEGFFAGLKSDECPIFGFNVTVPYKEKAIKYIDTFNPLVEKIRAVNTVVINKKRKLIGYNTDAPGFMAHLVELGFDPAGKQIVIIGAGGAARAIIGALCLIDPRPSSIRIYDIDKEKADSLIADLGQRINVNIVENVMDAIDLDIENSDLIINATPLGYKKTDPLPVDVDLLGPHNFVYDLIYNPAETPLLKAAKARGAQTSNGLGMLYYQGVLAFQHWAEMQLDDDVKNVMREALEDGLKQ